MATLSTRKRNSLSKTQFGLPEERKYPMPDKAHARNAKARAAQQEENRIVSSVPRNFAIFFSSLRWMSCVPQMKRTEATP